MDFFSFDFRNYSGILWNWRETISNFAEIIQFNDTTEELYGPGEPEAGADTAVWGHRPAGEGQHPPHPHASTKGRKQILQGVHWT